MSGLSQADLPRGYTVCPSCNTNVFKVERNRQRCRDCATDRSRERSRDWARSNPLTEDQRRVREVRRKDRMARLRLAGIERSKPADITWPADGGPDLAWTVRVTVPFSWAYSKNAIWRNVGRGHVVLGEEAKAVRDGLGVVIRAAMAGQTVVRNKVWLDILVEKPSQRGDAINVLDTVADALKVAIGLDDIWFSVRRLDWRVVSTAPRLFVGFGQEVGAVDSQHCSVCGRLLPLTEDHFTKNRSTPTGLNRECRACRSAIRRSTAAVKP